MRRYEGAVEGAGRRVAIVVARFNGQITERLLEGALAGLAKHGVRDDDISVAWVPGAFEIPLVAARFARSGEIDAVIALGAVIRGETYHFDLVANEAARGISEVVLETGVPVVFEVLATNDMAQAEARAGGVHGNKGWEAAEAALEMAGLVRSLPGPGARGGTR